MGNTSISWTNRTWNPLVGCTRVTSGCDHCYAFDLHTRRHENYMRHNGLWAEGGKPMPPQYARPFDDVQLMPDRLQEPLHIRKPSMFFVNSVSDLFHSGVPDSYIREVFAVMEKAHWHTFQVLTKRAGRLRLLGPSLTWPKNVWMGVSIEKDNLTPRANALRTVPAAVRFISAEPLLGPLPSLNLDGISWLICGGESGAGYRPMDLDWARELRDMCASANTAYFYKQGASRLPGKDTLLDGVEWHQFPQTA
jgi:protein gp37